MNPFSNDSDYFDLHAIPSIVINPRKSGSKFGELINPNYTVSIQGNPKYSCFREENYMKLIGDATARGIPRTVIYHAQYIMDSVLSQIKVSERYLPFLSSICVYIVSRLLLPRRKLQNLQNSPSFSYKSLITQAETIYQKNQEWLDYCIFYVMSLSDDILNWKCPYTFCIELLDSIHFPQFQMFAFTAIDIVCSNERSLSLSPHTIAYLSITSLMKKYYGISNGREPVPLEPIDVREQFLCLDILSISFYQLHNVCIQMTTSIQPIVCNESKQNTSLVKSPKSQSAELNFL